MMTVHSTEPVYDMIGQEIHVGDTILYALGIGGASLMVYKVLDIGHNEWFDGRASLQVMPILGTRRTVKGKFSTRMRGVDFPRNAIVITGTELETKVLAHFKEVAGYDQNGTESQAPEDAGTAG